MESYHKKDTFYWFDIPKRQRMLGAILVVPACALLLILSFIQEKGGVPQLFLAIVALICLFFYGKQYQRLEGATRQDDTLFVWKGFLILWPLPIIWRTHKTLFTLANLQIKQQKEGKSEEKYHRILLSGRSANGKKKQWYFFQPFVNRDDARKHVQTLKKFCFPSKENPTKGT